jgi:hypothetical protein
MSLSNSMLAISTQAFFFNAAATGPIKLAGHVRKLICTLDTYACPAHMYTVYSIHPYIYEDSVHQCNRHKEYFPVFLVHNLN